MSDHQAPFASDWHRLNHVFSVQFIMPPANAAAIFMNVEWAPRLPTAREAKLLHNKYRQVRDQFLASFARRTGANIACVELPA